MTTERADFEQMVGECFADVVSPPVPFEQASAHECFEAIQDVLGAGIGLERFAALTFEDREALSLGFGRYFECDPPTTQQILSAVHEVIARGSDENS